MLQSHAERLGHASADWEVESESFPPIIARDHEQMNGDRSLALSESAERSPFTQSLTLFEQSQQIWDEDFQVSDWPRHFSNQQSEEVSFKALICGVLLNSHCFFSFSCICLHV